MGDLISRAALLHSLNEQAPKPTTDDLYTVNLCIINAPTVDAVPIKHAKWDILVTEHFGDKWQADAICSCCELTKFSIWSGYFPDIPAVMAREITNHYASKVKLPKYCERCGAKMDGETNEPDRH